MLQFSVVSLMFKDSLRYTLLPFSDTLSQQSLVRANVCTFANDTFDKKNNNLGRWIYDARLNVKISNPAIGDVTDGSALLKPPVNFTPL